MSAPESDPAGRPVQWSCELLDFGPEGDTWLPLVPGYRDVWPSSPGWTVAQ